MEKFEVCRSRSSMPSACIAASTSAIAAELASSASRAVSASRTTVSVSTAMSGAISAVPSPETTMRGVGSVCCASAACGAAVTALARSVRRKRRFV
jgi:hypothetical protein